MRVFLLGNMIAFAKSGGVTLSCPDDGRYSFYNSPYPSHRLMTGVDMYPSDADDGLARSPISGEILQVRRVKAPQGKDFASSDHDTVTVISTGVNGSIVKILHVDTELDVGNRVRTGDPLGPMIRSGYFGYQTPLHAHVEVRPVNDPLRVRGGFIMESLLKLGDMKTTQGLNGIVVAARKGYALIRPPKNHTWVVADAGGRPGIIDGGIPLYGWFGLHTDAPESAVCVNLAGTIIGMVMKIGLRSCVADCLAFNAWINKVQVDLFFTLTPRSGTMITATSRRRGQLDLHEGDAAEVALA